MNNSKQLIDGALLTAVFIVLFLVSMYVPGISLFTALLLAVPFILFSAKYDWKSSLIMLVVAATLSMLFGSLIALPVPIMAALGGIMIGSAIYHDYSPYETWARGTVGFVLGILFSFVFNLYVVDVNYLDVFNEQIDQIMDMSHEMIMDLGMDEEYEAQFTLLEQQVEMFKNLVPFGIVLASILLALLNQWLSYKLLNRLERKQLHFPRFRNLRFPTGLIWIYLLAIIISLFQADLNEPVVIALQNILTLVGLFMIIQGFSFIFFYVHHKHLSKAIPVIAIVLTVFFAPILLPLVRILGIIDIGFGLRSLIKK
ncbi:YybS family protein [Ornithinibacillus xuwenensis]|uniref:YybS family protein n=1 Tax=Ornithinibacillus xuwenensis TaxID=3144668 RepID=A0ABU9XI51_9BACI